MKQSAKNWMVVGVVGVIIVATMTDWIHKSIALLSSVPWFVYLLVAAILFCGYQFARLSREDYKSDQEWIEEEGNVFLRRIEKEKERRGLVNEQESDEIEYVFHHENEGQ